MELNASKINYKINCRISHEQFRSLLINSSLAKRRPIDDVDCLKGMLQNSNLIVSAWLEGELIGIARSVTDFHYACYLSDLAVAKTYQRRGIGRRLQAMTMGQLGPHCKLLLIAAPAAHSYYQHIGFIKNDRCWVCEPDQRPPRDW